MSDSDQALVEILERGGDADDVLRRVVEHLAEQPSVAWAGIAFVEGDALVLGPGTGTPDESARVRTPIRYDGSLVGELWVDGRTEESVVTGVAAAVAPYVLIGWDTQGKTWKP